VPTLKANLTCRALTLNNVLHQFHIVLLAVERTDVISAGARGWRKFYQDGGHILQYWH